MDLCFFKCKLSVIYLNHECFRGRRRGGRGVLYQRSSSEPETSGHGVDGPWRCAEAEDGAGRPRVVMLIMVMM